MGNDAYIMVCVTCASRDEAQKIVDALLDQKLIACANIIQQVDSFFWWQGKKDFANESLFVAKTVPVKLDDVIKAVRHAHSYDVPEIIALPIVGGSKEYLDWITDSVS